MLTIPPDLLSRYDASLARNEIPEYQRPHDRRWLRFYLDFCAKYERPARERDSVRGFLRKLKDKGQAEWMRKQATDAVRLFFFLDAPAGQRPPGARTDARVPDPGSAGQAAVGPSVRGREGGAARPAIPAGRDQARTAVPDRGARLGSASAAAVARTGPPHQAPKQVDTRAPRLPVAPLPPVPEPSPAATAGQGPNGWPALYERLDAAIKVRHYSAKTLKTYRSWARKLQGFTRNKPPPELTVEDVTSFLTHLAVDKQVSASSQNQAFNALLFVFRHVPGREFGQVDGVVRAKKRPYVPVVLSREEVQRLLSRLAPPFDLPAQLLYGCGLRLFECLKLRYPHHPGAAGPWQREDDDDLYAHGAQRDGEAGTQSFGSLIGHSRRHRVARDDGRGRDQPRRVERRFGRVRPPAAAVYTADPIAKVLMVGSVRCAGQSGR